MLIAENNETTINASVAGISFFFARNASSAEFNQNQFNAYLQRLFSGDIINESEQRAAWHTEFRNPASCELVKDSLERICHISDSVRKKQWFFDVTDVVNIGIGGSDLGPQLICEAFADAIDGPRVHFVSNLDLTQINLLLKKLSPQNTLFVITSKSFRTLETLENMHVAKQWFLDANVDPSQHLIAITSNPSVAIESHQISQSHVLSIPEWMGGRYSIWSAVGLSCAIAFGFEKFYEMHQGAHEMDQHFLRASVEDNQPLQYALMMHDALMNQQLKTLIVLPYAHRLRGLPDYLQQLWMESLGKSVDAQGEKINHPTGPIVFGSVGTNSQHSFQQLMMQGTHPIFVDFILPLEQTNMIANCLMQVKTLRDGVETQNPLKQIIGNKIANLFVLDQLNLKTLGALLAFYEHAVVSLAYILKVNPFDQFGVEHAKVASANLIKELGMKKVDVAQVKQILNN